MRGRQDRRKIWSDGCKWWRGRFFVPALLVMMWSSSAWTCEVTDVWLYLAENEDDAYVTEDTTLTICPKPYWLRVIIVHWEAGYGDENPFRLEVHDITKDLCLLEDDNIADTDYPDPEIEQVVSEVGSPPEAFSTGEHDLRAYACRKDVGEWVESNQSTVTFEGCTAGNKYVRADVVDYGMVDGIQGTIMTRYGDLCCEDKGGTAEAFQVAWVNIGTIAVGTAKWGQLGYGKQRNAGFTTTYKYRYWEVKRHDVAEPEDTYATDLAPDEGDEHVYKIRFERSTGTLKFYVDGSLWEEHPDDDDDYWTTNKNLHYAGWAGEILNEEDDMPGTESSRCDFTDCGYWKVGSGYTDAGFVEPDSYFSSDDSKWPWDHESTTSFNIYDKYPGE